MTTTTITSSSALRAAFAKAAAEATEVRVATAWASMSCPEARALAGARDRIRSMVVGLDFDATDPAFLKHFSENRSEAEAGAPVKTFRDSGTFHPKVYLFNTRSAFTAIVGSSNFTDGGFGSNLEMNLLVTGKVSDSVFLELQGWIDALYERGDFVSPEGLVEYAEAFARRQRERAKTRRYTPSPKVVAANVKVGQTRDEAWLEGFLGEVRGRMPVGTLKEVARSILKGIEATGGKLTFRRNPHGFTVGVPLPGDPRSTVSTMIVETYPTYVQVGFVYQLAYDHTLRILGREVEARRAFNRLKAAVKPFAHRHAKSGNQSSAWLDDLVGREDELVSALASFADWLAAREAR